MTFSHQTLAATVGSADAGKVLAWRPTPSLAVLVVLSVVVIIGHGARTL